VEIFQMRWANNYEIITAMDGECGPDGWTICRI
jgi:hypothetical protein